MVTAEHAQPLKGMYGSGGEGGGGGEQATTIPHDEWLWLMAHGGENPDDHPLIAYCHTPASSGHCE